MRTLRAGPASDSRQRCRVCMGKHFRGVANRASSDPDHIHQTVTRYPWETARLLRVGSTGAKIESDGE
eukprot:221525-Rhodomonas_salina.1